MTASLAEICDICLQAARRGQLSDALAAVQSFVWREALTRGAAAGRVFASAALDELCQTLGALEPTPAPAAARSGVVYVATELRLIGGHTRVLADLIMAQTQAAEPGAPTGPVTILVTDVVGQHDPSVGEVFARLDVAVEVAVGADHAARLAWMKRRLAQLAPRVTRMAIHPFDSVSVAAVQPSLVGELSFLHNADHNLCLGVTLAHAQHVDFHAKGFHHCRDHEGVRRNVFWPLTAEDLGPRSADSFGRAPIRTCTAGGPEKFARNEANYLYVYEDLAPLIPATTGGVHVHIGPLPDATLEKIRGGLQALGVPPDRFVHQPFAPNLWQALLSLGIDVYVGSFPLGGGRATVEAMGAGLPLCIHSNYRSIFFSAENEVYDGAMIWRTPRQLTDQLRALTPERLASHARASRLHYEQNHLLEHLAAAMKGEVREPPRPRHTQDRLQAFLDETWAQARSPDGRS